MLLDSERLGLTECVFVLVAVRDGELDRVSLLLRDPERLRVRDTLILELADKDGVREADDDGEEEGVCEGVEDAVEDTDSEVDCDLERDKLCECVILAE